MRVYLKGLLPYYRHVLGTIVVGSIFGLVMNTSVVLPAILLGRAIDTVGDVAAGTAPRSAVGWAVLAYLAGVLITEGARAVKRWCLERTIPRMRCNIQADAVRGVLGWPLSRLHATPIGGLMSRIVGDAEVIRRGTDQLTVEVWDTFLMCFSLAAALFVYDWQLSLLTLLPLPAAIVVAHTTGRWIRARTLATREANAVLTAALQEDLTGLRVLRLFGRRDAAVARVAALSRAQSERSISQARLEGALRPAYGAIMSVGAVWLVWQGGERVLAGAMTLGGFVAYLELYLRFVERALRLPQVTNAVQAGAAAWERVGPLLAPALPVNSEPRYASFMAGHIAGIDHEPPAPPVTKAGPAALRLESVTLRYPGSQSGPALHGVNLDVQPGSLVAVTGPVGSGKTALARALMGLYPLESGRVLIDGVALATISRSERAARAGYLPQDPFLFSGTVRDNVLMRGDGVSDEDEAQVARAVALAALEDDVRHFPRGLDSELGESGIRVSGGQRQRIALARALAAQRRIPGLLVLDDPFSAVDVDTEARIVAALRAACGPDAPPEERATIVLCSHRLAAFPHADRIVVLDRGRVSEAGRHDELLAAGGLYARIYRAQQFAQRVEHA